MLQAALIAEVFIRAARIIEANVNRRTHQRILHQIESEL